MGTWTRNFLVANAKPAEVREIMVRWLERKGFDLRERPALLPVERDDARSASLVSNSRWVAVVYNEAFEEGDRLLSELTKLPTVVEVWNADSDVWGYSLYKSAELTAAFSSNPEYND